MKTTVEQIRAIYNEFGLDVHSVPPNIQSQVNALARALHMRRQKKNCTPNNAGKAGGKSLRSPCSALCFRDGHVNVLCQTENPDADRPLMWVRQRLLPTMVGYSPIVVHEGDMRLLGLLTSARVSLDPNHVQ